MRGHIEHTQMSGKELERYSKQILVKNIGGVGQKKLKSSKVLVIGLGGLGSPVVTHLSSSGIGKIGLVDNDKVDLSNIHRQSLYNVSDIKKSKVLVAKKKLKKINSKTNIICHKIRIDKNNLTPKEVLLMQQECMYFRASPKYGSYKTNK